MGSVGAHAIVRSSIPLLPRSRPALAQKGDGGAPSPSSIIPQLAAPAQAADAGQRYSAALLGAGFTETYTRPLRLVANSTLPSARANRVWSVPMPTLEPGCTLV